MALLAILKSWRIEVVGMALVALSGRPIFAAVTSSTYLKASNTGVNDQFGVSVASTDEWIVVGAALEDSSASGVNGDGANNGLGNSGAAYVFAREGQMWIAEAYLKASNTGPSDEFGATVALSGDTIAVAAPLEDSASTGIDGNQLENTATNSGAVYIFVRDGDDWSQQAYIKASDTTAGDEFGRSLSLFGTTLVVGAPGKNSGRGGAYVFIRTGTTWSQQAALSTPNGSPGDQFGAAVSIWSDWLAVGAPNEDSNATGINGSQFNDLATDSGAVYVFLRNGASWSQHAFVKASNTGGSLSGSDGGDRFGCAVAMRQNMLLVGASGEDSSANTVNGDQSNNSSLASGAAYLLVREAAWSHRAYLKASNGGAGDQFGAAVAFSGDALIVAAPSEDGSATGINGTPIDDSATSAGASYLFALENGAWAQQAYLKASNTQLGDGFCSALSASDLHIVCGAVFEDGAATDVGGDAANNSASNSGAAYVFARSPDADADGIVDDSDNCPLADNSLQSDADGDGVGDACDVCSDTPAGLAVGAGGRPLHDLNQDCRVDGDDVQLIVNGLLAP